MNLIYPNSHSLTKGLLYVGCLPSPHSPFKRDQMHRADSGGKSTFEHCLYVGICLVRCRDEAHQLRNEYIDELEARCSFSGVLTYSRTFVIVSSKHVLAFGKDCCITRLFGRKNTISCIKVPYCQHSLS